MAFQQLAHRTLSSRPDSIDIERLVFSPKGHGTPLSSAQRRRNRSHGYRVFEVSLLLLMAGCIALSFLRFHSHLKALEVMEATPVIDVVGVSLKPSCVTRQAVASLNLYLKPRTIHVVTTSADKCHIYMSFAPNVRCHLQDEFLPGVTTDGVGDYIRDRVGVDEHKQYKGRQLSGWYMQQFAKLGAALALPDLTEYFVVWDLDMVLLSPVQILWPLNEGAPTAAASAAVLNGAEAAAESAGDADAVVADPSGARAASAGGAGDAGAQMQTLVNVGGSVSKGYMSSFRKLMHGRGLEFAPDGSSFVTHWMVVYRPYMKEFLAELAAEAPPDAPDGGAAGPMAWVWRILSAVDAVSADLGFSEYASYISWVRQHYPHSQRLARHKTWVRHPFGQRAIRALRHLHPDGCCCPSWLLLKLVQALGFVYTGYEVGHIAECRYSDPRYDVSYGLGQELALADGDARVLHD